MPYHNFKSHKKSGFPKNHRGGEVKLTLPLPPVPSHFRVNTLLNFVLQNKLFNPWHSDFLPGNSFVSHLISITHKIYKTFYCLSTTNMRKTFHDTSKAFDNVWLESFIFEIMMVLGNVLKLLENYVTNCQQTGF